MSEKILIIGGDSFIGAELQTFLRLSGYDVMSTTRKKNMIGKKNFLYLDLNNQESFLIKQKNFSTAFICAGITSIAKCEYDSINTRKINVINTISLVKELISNGTRIVYISSSAVFDGNNEWPNEFSLCNPSCEYGKQKLAVESLLLSSSTSETPATIVRLTKVLSVGSGILKNYMEKNRLNLSSSYFIDLNICPISISYVIQSIMTIFRSKAKGIFHLSGDTELSYFDFLMNFSSLINADQSLIGKALVEDLGSEVIFRPTHSGLGMKYTNKELGIQPESLSHMMNSLIKSYNF
jgi:dTDP-4-dehydrorhamnose reductase